MSKVTISEHAGVRNLHLDSPWVQGSMRISAPDALELEYVQQMMMWMLFMPRPQHIAQLGLGAGSLTKFCYRQFPQTPITTIELSSAVISVCTSLFALPPNDSRLNVINMDAREFVMNERNNDSFDILQVDLYGEDASEPALDSPEFYQDCAHCLTSTGMLTVNLLGSLCAKQNSLQALQRAFQAVVWLPETQDGNLVVIAFKSAPQVDFQELYEHAAGIHRVTGLPAEDWVRGLEAWMMDA